MIALCTPPSPPPTTVPAGTKLLGEVITWSCSGSVAKHADLISALTAADLDAGVARSLAPRHAFTRACKKLARDRVIRQVAEDREAVTFQFTAESRAGDRLEYTLETLLTLDKKSGLVACDLPGLAALAQEELDRCVELRTGADVTRVVQKLFERSADLFPVREAGGCYFVPAQHVEFVDRVERFLGRLNGRVARFPVPAGTPSGDASVKDAVASGLAALVADYRAAVANFDADTRASTIERAAEKIRTAKFKVEAYAAYLAEERERLELDLATAQDELRAKVSAMSADHVAA